jgi:hypothetical protein
MPGLAGMAPDDMKIAHQPSDRHLQPLPQDRVTAVEKRYMRRECRSCLALDTRLFLRLDNLSLQVEQILVRLAAS